MKGISISFLQGWDEEFESSFLMTFLPELMQRQALMLQILHMICASLMNIHTVNAIMHFGEPKKGQDQSNDNIDRDLCESMSKVIRSYVSLALAFAKVSIVSILHCMKYCNHFSILQYFLA